jgi:putative transposase
MGRALLQSDRNATLLVDVLRTCVAAGRFHLRDFVIMPNHLHLLITVRGDTTIEKAMQFIKGGFSFRLKKETGYAGEVWQRGYSEVRVSGESEMERYRDYIARNPIRAGLASAPNTFRWCFEFLKRQKAAGAEAQSPSASLRPD